MDNLSSVFSLLVSSSSQHSTFQHPKPSRSSTHSRSQYPHENSDSPAMSNDLRRTSTSTAVHPGPDAVMNEKNRPMQTLIDDVGDRERGYHHHHDHERGPRRDKPSRDDAPFATSHRKFANPTPFGFFCLGISIFTVALVSFDARGTRDIPVFLAAPAIWVGGIGQILAGMWEMACGNTLGATGFTTYGLWWVSYGWYLSPWSSISAAYAANPAQMNYIAGFYDIAYFLFSMCLVVAALRASLALVAVFFTLGFVYFMNGIGSFVHHDALAVAAGVFGFLNALAAFYAAFSGLLTNETSYFLLPVGDRRPAAARHGAYHE